MHTSQVLNVTKIATYLTFSTLCLLAAGYYWYDLSQVESQHKKTPLAETINACDMIAEKAAMHLPQALPFQRLEKQARRMRVFDRCMQDRGFKENPAWATYVQPYAQKAALRQQVSIGEAYENMRRESMLVHQISHDAPLYWMPAKAVK